jgi:2'-5' RNA ligase
LLDTHPSTILGVPRSGLIIEVPESEPAVASWRERLDPQAALGVPAHITVLFPFAAPDRLDEVTITTLREVFTASAPFTFHLTRTAWFGDKVLWLAPEPRAPFERLTKLVADAFPSFPPYGGQFSEVVPHLTVGDHGTLQQLVDAEHEIRRHLPISAAADALSLMVERSGGRWKRLATFPLIQLQ